jgi:hypothetical protein
MCGLVNGLGAEKKVMSGIYLLLVVYYDIHVVLLRQRDMNVAVQLFESSFINILEGLMLHSSIDLHQFRIIVN